MAQGVYYNPYLMLGTDNISVYVKSCKPNFNPEIHDATRAGHTGRARAHGLDDWSFDVELHQDFANGIVDDIIYALFRAGTCAVTFKPNGSTTSTDNPKWTGTGMIEAYSPLADGAVGARMTTSSRVVANGTVIARAEAD